MDLRHSCCSDSVNNENPSSNDLFAAFLSDLTFWGDLPAHVESQPSSLYHQQCPYFSRGQTSSHFDRLNANNPNFFYMSDTTSASSRSHIPPPLTETAWCTAVDPASQRVYYYDAVTRKVQWEKPREIRRLEKQQRSLKRRRARKFFREMEYNIYRSLSRGERIPGVPPSSSLLLLLQQEQQHRGTTNGGLARESRTDDSLSSPPGTGSKTPPRNRMRTISGMDEVLVQELSDDIILLPTSQPVKTATTNAASKARSHPNLPPLPRQHTLKREETDNSLEFSPEESRNPSFLSTQPLSQQQVLHPLMRDDTSPETVDLRGEVLLLEGPTQTTTTTNTTAAATTNTKAAIAGYDLPPSQQTPLHSHHVRRNTDGTVHVQSTMMNPNIDATIKCVCGVYRAHIQQGTGGEGESWRGHPKGYFQQGQQHVFEDLSPPLSRFSEVPPLEEIVLFYQDFYGRSKMEHDTIIMSLIYIERLVKETPVVPSPTNWRSILFACMVLASKVWDDLSMWNIDFSNVCSRGRSSRLVDFTLPRINQLELGLLKSLNFNVKVPASLYAKYYFLIRSMLIKSGLLQEEVVTPTDLAYSPERRTSPPQPRHRGTKSVDDACFLLQAGIAVSKTIEDQKKRATTSVCLKQRVLVGQR